jgi:hypothetical protein
VSIHREERLSRIASHAHHPAAIRRHARRRGGLPPDGGGGRRRHAADPRGRFCADPDRAGRGTGRRRRAHGLAGARGAPGRVSGLSWSDDFAAAGDPQSAGVARLAWWIGLAAFVAAGGQLTVVGGLVDSVRHLPVGTVGSMQSAGGSILDLAIAMPAMAISLAVTLAIPALAAVLAFHLAAVFCLRTVALPPGAGFLQGMAAVVLLAAVWLGLRTWTDGGVAMTLGSIADCFAPR